MASDQITMGSLIGIARAGGFDTAPWRQRAGLPLGVPVPRQHQWHRFEVVI